MFIIKNWLVKAQQLSINSFSKNETVVPKTLVATNRKKRPCRKRGLSRKSMGMLSGNWSHLAQNIKAFFLLKHNYPRHVATPLISEYFCTLCKINCILCALFKRKKTDFTISTEYHQTPFHNYYFFNISCKCVFFASYKLLLPVRSSQERCRVAGGKLFFFFRKYVFL